MLEYQNYTAARPEREPKPRTGIYKMWPWEELLMRQKKCRTRRFMSLLLTAAMVVSLLPVNGLALSAGAEEALILESTGELSVSVDGRETALESAADGMQAVAVDAESSEPVSDGAQQSSDAAGDLALDTEASSGASGDLALETEASSGALGDLASDSAQTPSGTVGNPASDGTQTTPGAAGDPASDNGAANVSASDSTEAPSDGEESAAADSAEITAEDLILDGQEDFADGLEILSIETELSAEELELLSGESQPTGDSVASVTVGGVAEYYDDLTQAWADAQGQTAEITLLKDVTDISAAFTITDEDTNITFSGQGYKLSGSITTNGIFRVRAGCLRITGGEIENTASANAYGVLVTNTGRAEISGGKIIGGNSGNGIGVRADGSECSIALSGDAEVQGYYGIYLYIGPEAEISGGEVTGIYMGLCVNNAPTVISGGTFSASASPYAIYSVNSANPVRGFLAAGCAYYFDGEPFAPTEAAIMVKGPVTVKECTHKWAWEDDCDGLHHTRTCDACGKTESGEHNYGADNICADCGADKNAEPVARITMSDGTVLNYTNLGKGWNAAQGHTATIEVLKSVDLGNSYLQIKNADSSITLKMVDGVVVSGSSNSGVIYAAGGSLVIESGTIQGTMYGVNIASGGSVEIRGGAVNATSGSGYGIYLNSSAENTSSVAISGGTINENATASSPRFGIYIGGNSRAVVSGSAVIKGAESGISMENGSAEISGGVIESISSGASTYGLNVTGGSVVMTGGKLIGGVGLRMSGDNTVVKVSGGSVESKNVDGMLISGGSFTLSGEGTVIGGTTGVGMTGGSFKMTGGAVTTKEITGNYSGTCVNISGGSFKMSGGVVTAWSTGFNPSYGVGVSGSADIEISGGMVTATHGYSLYRFVDDIKSSTIALTGGIYRGDSGTVYDSIGTAGGLLGAGCAYREIRIDADENITDGEWVTDEELLGEKELSGLTAVRVSQLPMRVALTDTEAVYGETAVLEPEVNPVDESKPITYQWYKGEEKLDGEVAEKLTVSGLDVGEYSYYCQVTCDGYTITSNTARVTVKPKPLTVLVSAANKTYDGGTAAVISAAIDAAQLAGADRVAVSGLTGAFADAKAGSGKTVNVDFSKVVVTGNDRGNYSLVYPTTVTATISPAPLTITGAVVAGKTSDGSTAADVTSVSFSGVIAGESLKPGVDYSASGSFASAQAGTHNVTVTVVLMNGNYKLAGSQFTASGTIQAAPADTAQTADNTGSVSQLNAGLKAVWSGSTLKVSWGKVKAADGYEVYAARCGKSMKLVKTVKKQSTVSAKVKKISGTKLKTSANYKVRVKAYRMVNGKKTYIATSLLLHTTGSANKKYTNASRVKVSKTSVSLKKGKTSKISATVTKQNSKKKLLGKNHAARLRYWSTNTKVATVTSGGKIKAVGAGKCYVYVMAQNGVQTRVKVTVK